LCGEDPLTGKNYEYRRSWIYQMQAILAGLFGIDIGFRAELSNHIHLLLRNRPDDEAAILICGIYIDLNQIRAGEAETPETSVHTSAFDRILARQRFLKALREAEELSDPGTTPDGWLCELTLDERVPITDVRHFQSARGLRASDKGLLSLTLDQYLELLDTTGRVIQPGKSGSIPSHLEGILDRLGIRADKWTTVISGHDKLFGKIVGAPFQVIRRAQAAGCRWYRGITACKSIFSCPG
jgi:hypothetical protein